MILAVHFALYCGSLAEDICDFDSIHALKPLIHMHACMHACMHTHTKTPWPLWLVVLHIWFQSGTSTSLASCLSHLTPCYIVQGPQMSETYVLRVSISVVPNTCILYWVSGSYGPHQQNQHSDAAAQLRYPQGLDEVPKFVYLLHQYCQKWRYGALALAAEHHTAPTICIYKLLHQLTDAVLG